MNFSRPCMLLALVLAAVTLLNAGTAHASDVSDELIVGTINATATSARSGFVADRVRATVSLPHGFEPRIDGLVTRDSPAGQAPLVALGKQGTTVTRWLVGTGWDVSSRLTLGADLLFSPATSTTTGTTVMFASAAGAAMVADAQLRSTTKSWGGELSADYEPEGTSNAETSWGLYAGVVTYDSAQKISAFQGANGGVVTSQRLHDYCLVNTCSNELKSVLAKEQSALSQFHVALSATDTLFGRTDVGLLGTLYLYSSDPTQAGYFGASAFGRGASVGDGLPIAPLLWSVRPNVLGRMGNFRAGGSIQYGRYVGDNSTNVTVAAKVQYNLTKTLRAWLSVNGQRDVDSALTVTRITSIGVGLRYVF